MTYHDSKFTGVPLTILSLPNLTGWYDWLQHFLFCCLCGEWQTQVEMFTVINVTFWRKHEQFDLLSTEMLYQYMEHSSDSYDCHVYVSIKQVCHCKLLHFSWSTWSVIITLHTHLRWFSSLWCWCTNFSAALRQTGRWKWQVMMRQYSTFTSRHKGHG